MDAVATRETHLVYAIRNGPSANRRRPDARSGRPTDAVKGQRFSHEAVTHPARVLRALETGQFDAVLMDLNYTRDTVGGGEGLELVSRIRSMYSLLPVVVMTAWSSVDLAVEAVRRGAWYWEVVFVGSFASDCGGSRANREPIATPFLTCHFAFLHKYFARNPQVG